MQEEGRGGCKRARVGGSEVTPLDAGRGARVMSGSGESAKNMEGLVRAVKIYDAGVEGGHLTASQGCDWANTLVNCGDNYFLGTDRDVLNVDGVSGRNCDIVLQQVVCSIWQGNIFCPLALFELGQAKGVISSWSNGGTVLQRAGSGFNCSAT